MLKRVDILATDNPPEYISTEIHRNSDGTYSITNIFKDVNGVSTTIHYPRVILRIDRTSGLRINEIINNPILSPILSFSTIDVLKEIEDDEHSSLCTITCDGGN